MSRAMCRAREGSVRQSRSRIVHRLRRSGRVRGVRTTAPVSPNWPSRAGVNPVTTLSRLRVARADHGLAAGPGVPGDRAIDTRPRSDKTAVRNWCTRPSKRVRPQTLHRERSRAPVTVIVTTYHNYRPRPHNESSGASRRGGGRTRPAARGRHIAYGRSRDKPTDRHTRGIIIIIIICRPDFVFITRAHAHRVSVTAR